MIQNLAIVDDLPLSRLQAEPRRCGYSINDDGLIIKPLSLHCCHLFFPPLVVYAATHLECFPFHSSPLILPNDLSHLFLVWYLLLPSRFPFLLSSFNKHPSCMSCTKSITADSDSLEGSFPFLISYLVKHILNCSLNSGWEPSCFKSNKISSVDYGWLKPPDLNNLECCPFCLAGVVGFDC